jgi:hypothetical protein
MNIEIELTDEIKDWAENTYSTHLGVDQLKDAIEKAEKEPLMTSQFVSRTAFHSWINRFKASLDAMNDRLEKLEYTVHKLEQIEVFREVSKENLKLIKELNNNIAKAIEDL